MYKLHQLPLFFTHESISYSIINPVSSNFFSKKHILLFLYIFIVITLQNQKAYAWHTLTHPFLSEIALNSLPEEMQYHLAQYIERVQWGAMDPDVTIKDWPNHEITIHTDSQQSSYVDLSIKSKKYQDANVISRTRFLYDSIIEKLKSAPVDYSEVAYELGLISHYIADICQPLHTDETSEEAEFHVEYETNIYLWQDNFVFEESGYRLINVNDLNRYMIETANRANRYYTGISKSYTEKKDNLDTKGITWLCMQKAVETIRNIWISAWYQSRAPMNTIALHSNKRVFTHGETINISLSMLSGVSVVPDTELYIAMVDPAGRVWFLTSDSHFSEVMTPWKRNLEQNTIKNRLTDNVDDYTGSENIPDSTVLNALLWPQVMEGEYHFYAAMLSQPELSAHEDYEVASNISEITVKILKSTTFSLTGLTDEIYIFPAIDEDTKSLIPLPLKRWDLIFVGEREDIPASPVDENMRNILIPGKYNHLFVYLGRDMKGSPYGMEMTTFFNPEGYDLRLTRLPEYDLFDHNSEAVPVPVVSKDLWSHSTRWAKRFSSENLAKVRQNEQEIMAFLEENWTSKVNYQLEFDWSGDLQDSMIYLVDDGLQDGAGCTDYWLSLFENIAGVCIYGSRMSAQEVKDYFKNDPLGKTATVPEEFNPFPFSLYVNELLLMGFDLIDPDPHIFSCDNSSETGIAIPGLVLQSEQLQSIYPAPAVSDWP